MRKGAFSLWLSQTLLLAHCVGLSLKWLVFCPDFEEDTVFGEGLAPLMNDSDLFTETGGGGEKGKDSGEINNRDIYFQTKETPRRIVNLSVDISVF